MKVKEENNSSEENNILHRPKRLCFNGSTNAFYAFLISKHDKERINHYRDSYFPPLRHVSLSTVLYTILQQSLPRSDIHSFIQRYAADIILQYVTYGQKY